MQALGRAAQRQQEPQAGQIGVAVGVRRAADLHQADHGHERAEEPQPADEHTRQAPAREPSAGADREQQRRVEEQRHDLQLALRQGVVAGQVHRPEAVPQVPDVRIERILESQRERPGRGFLDRPARGLRAQRQNAGPEGQAEEGQRGEVGLARARARAPERPPFEQHEQAGQRDEHPLRHQAAGVERERRSEPPSLPLALPGQPHEQAREAEEGAQEILALDDPGHRLHAQRVDGEEQRACEGVRARETQALEKRQHEQRVGRVPGRVLQLVPGGTQTEEPDIQHVREPGQRVPVGRREARERPAHVFPREPGQHVLVVRQIGARVVLDELVSGRLRVEHEHRDEQRERRRQAGEERAGAHRVPPA